MLTNMTSTRKWLRGSSVKPVPSLKPFYPDEGECAQIDASIADIIRRLNDLGCETWVSCSGLDCDHRMKGRFGHAYIGFTEKLPPRIISVFLHSAFWIEKGNSTVRVFRLIDEGLPTERRVDGHGRPGSDAMLAANWQDLRRRLAELI